MRAVPPEWRVLLLGAGVLCVVLVLGSGHALELQIVNFNYESLKVTWNTSGLGATNLSFLYKLARQDNFTHCPHYLLQGGLTLGCQLQQELGDVMLYLRVVNGTDLVLARNMYIGDYLKPAAPHHLQFRWEEDAVTVTCANLRYRDLVYEIQHKTFFDSEWQSQEKDTCNVTFLGVDANKCHSFRARVRTSENSYGPDSLPSDWSPVVHQQDRIQAESCPARAPFRAFPKFILVSSLVLMLTLLLMALSVWKLHRMKDLFMPTVPDPKVTFLGLFESHQGNFQEWIQDTQNVMTLDAPDPDGISEEALLVHWVPEEPTSLAGPPAPSVPMVVPEVDSGQPLGRGQLVPLEGFTFVVQEDSYVTF